MKDRMDEYTRDLHENTRKTDRNAVLLAFVLAFQTIGLAIVQGYYSSMEACERDKIGVLKHSD